MTVTELEISRKNHVLTNITCYTFYLYTLAVSPSLGGSRQHKRNNKTMGISLRSSSNDEGPSRVWMALLKQHRPSSTTYVASRMPFPLLPLPKSCLYKATPWQQQMPIRTASQSFATHFYSSHAHLPPSHPSSYHSGLSLLHPSTQT